MAARRPPSGERRQVFDWKTVRIPISSVQFLVVVVLLGLLGSGLYLYRDRIPFERLGLGAVGRLLGVAGLEKSGDADAGADSVERFARLAFHSGDVKIQRAGGMDWTAADSRDRLSSGDRVRTFGGARAEVVFDDGSVLKIKPDSLIIIGDLKEDVRTKVRQSSVKLMVSSIEADIKKQVVEGSRFRLEMPTAVAEMGRARISVDVGPGQDSKLKVFNGEVAVDTGRDKVQVGENSQVSIGPGSELSAVSKLVAQPRITTPVNLTRVITNDPSKVVIDVRWEPVARVRGYHLQIDRDRRFAQPAIDRRDLRLTEFRAAALEPGVYYVRVSAEDSLGQEGPFAEPVAFMIARDVLAPEVVIAKSVFSRAGGGYDLFVEGTTEPSAVVRLGGRPVVVDDEGRFSATLRGIGLGERQVPLAARDAAGNETVLPLKTGGG